MKEKITDKLELIKTTFEETELTKTDIVLLTATFFMTGVVLGMLITPKKHVVIGSNNGNNNNGTLCESEDFDEEDD